METGVSRIYKAQMHVLSVGISSQATTSLQTYASLHHSCLLLLTSFKQQSPPSKASSSSAGYAIPRTL